MSSISVSSTYISPDSQLIEHSLTFKETIILFLRNRNLRFKLQILSYQISSFENSNFRIQISNFELIDSEF